MTADLIDRLARLGGDDFVDTVRAARAERRRRIRTALSNVRAELLSQCSVRKAARAINDAIRCRRVNSDPAVRRAIESYLKTALGRLDDVPAAERCQSALKFDPRSASNGDPSRALVQACPGSEREGAARSGVTATSPT
jgi:hypothetical protein